MEIQKAELDGVISTNSTALQAVLQFHDKSAMPIFCMQASWKNERPNSSLESEKRAIQKLIFERLS